MTPFEVIAVLLAGYLLGALPSAVLVARRYGVDILKAGSGNPGATNVKRVVGKTAGNLVFAMDALKGLAAAGWPLIPQLGAGQPVWLGILGMLAAVLGHSFSCFIGFRGGKGVAVSMGGLLILMPLPLAAGVVVWLTVFYMTRYVSAASLAFAASLPVVALAAHGQTSPQRVYLAFVLAVLIVWRHRENVRRLMDGTEKSFRRDRLEEA